MGSYITLGGKRVLEVSSQVENMPDAAPRNFLGRANSFRCPTGRNPGDAWLLMRRKDISDLDTTGFLELKWYYSENSAPSVVKLTVPSLIYCDAHCMDFAQAGDDSAAYLVQLQDKRALYRNSSINAQYNVRLRAPNKAASSVDEYDPEYFYEETLNSSALYTWQEMLDDIWGNLPGAGTAPTLPFSPDGNPENYSFVGVSAWDAYNDVLEKLSITVRYDPTASSNEITLVQVGEAQADLAANAAIMKPRLKFEDDPVTGNKHLPETVRVFFHKQHTHYGAEKTSPQTSNWITGVAHSIDKSTSISGAHSGSVLPVWDDLKAIVNNSGTVTNSSELDARAVEIAADVSQKLDVDQLGRIYGGIDTRILPGSKIKAVRWRDFGDSFAAVTEIAYRHPKENRGLRGLRGLMGSRGGMSSREPSHILRPPSQQVREPLYPPLAQLVRIDGIPQAGSGAPEAGSEVSENADGYHVGTVLQLVNGVVTELETCFIVVVNNYGTVSGESSLTVGDVYIGKLNGTVSTNINDSDIGVRPLYAIRADEIAVGSGSGSGCVPVRWETVGSQIHFVGTRIIQPAVRQGYDAEGNLCDTISLTPVDVDLCDLLAECLSCVEGSGSGSGSGGEPPGILNCEVACGVDFIGVAMTNSDYTTSGGLSVIGEYPDAVDIFHITGGGAVTWIFAVPDATCVGGYQVYTAELADDATEWADEPHGCCDQVWLDNGDGTATLKTDGRFLATECVAEIDCDTLTCGDIAAIDWEVYGTADITLNTDGTELTDDCFSGVADEDRIAGGTFGDWQALLWCNAANSGGAKLSLVVRRISDDNCLGNASAPEDCDDWESTSPPDTGIILTGDGFVFGVQEQ